MRFYKLSLLLCMSFFWIKTFVAQNTIDSLYKPLFKKNPTYIADGFDFPVGKPNAKGYYNAQAFTKNNHLGDDWNGTRGGDTDLGDPIYATANGYVTFSENVGGGWGNVIRIVHKIDDKTYVESLYAHCQTILVKPKTFVRRGTKIATIGNANGIYWAHLHLEIRSIVDMPIGNGYSPNTHGYMNPSVFIRAHRP
jgi:murein DD-endopeptidase MepM/ murein hydrolase activator NlpD